MGVNRKIKAARLVGALAVGFAGSSALASPPPSGPKIYLQTGTSTPAPALPVLGNSGTNSGNAANVGNFSNPQNAPPTTGANSILVIQGNNSSYLPSYVNGINSSGAGDSSDFLQVSGFNPTSDAEIYALKLDYGGSYLNPSTQSDILGDIISDINTINDPTFYPSGGTLASLVPASLNADFPNYDLILTIPSSYTSSVPTGISSEFDFGFDLSNFSEDSNITESVTVTDIGAVPEPASATLLGVLAIPALLRRRRTSN